MAVAFGVALWMDWSNPHWAGFSVAVISLSTAGESLNKGAMRMLGTLVAAVVALTLLALFPQDRWLLMGALTIYVAACTYMLTGKKRPYFWFVSAFVCIIIVVSGGPDSEHAFQTAVERSQETGLGILVYGLFCAFLWPQSSRPKLESASLGLIAVQHRLFQSYRGQMGGVSESEATRADRLEQVRLAGQIGPTLDAAAIDSYRVWEVRHLWRRFRDGAVRLGEVLEHWREGLPEVQDLNLKRVFPNLEAFCDELDSRFSVIEDCFKGNFAQPAPAPQTLALDSAEMRGLSHFQRAAAAVTASQLQRMEGLTRDLIGCARGIEDLSAAPESGPAETAAAPAFAIDLDRLISVIRVVAALWVAYLLWIYVDPPGHAAFAVMATVFALIFAMIPQVSPLSILPPFAWGTVFAGVIYVLVMPRLEGYWQLGLMIFVVTTAIYYLFSEPRQALAKVGAIIPFVALTAIENQQAYNFAVFANSAAMIMLAISLNVALAYIPTSPRSEKIFLRLFARFFRQIEFLLSRIALNWDQTAGFAGRLKGPIYSRGLLELWQRMAVNAGRIDYANLSETSPAAARTLVANLGVVAFRLKEVLEVRAQSEAKLGDDELLQDLRSWRLAILTQVRLWSADPEAAARQETDLQALLNGRLEKLEDRIEELCQDSQNDELDSRDHRELYRLLGSFRGLSESLIALAEAARMVSWRQWREARF